MKTCGLFTTSCALLLLSAFCPTGHAQSHCGRDETEYFSCKLAGSARVASLCGGNESGRPEGEWLQYRFGRPRQIELEYPPGKENSLKKFEAVHYSKYGYLSVLFINGQALYEIEVSEATIKGRPVHTAVIKVEFEKRTTELSCEKPVPASYWTDLTDLAPSTFKPSGDGRDGFLWQYHNRIAR